MRARACLRSDSSISRDKPLRDWCTVQGATVAKATGLAASTTTTAEEEVVGLVGWVKDQKKSLTSGHRLLISLVFSTLDWVLDWIVVWKWYAAGHTWWAAVMVFFIIFAGTMEAYWINMESRVRGLRLSMRVLGVGVYVEAVRYFWNREHSTDATIRETESSMHERTARKQTRDAALARFVSARGLETLMETFPCGALQLYVMITTGGTSTVNVLSIISSVLGLGYGVPSTLADWPNPKIQHFVKSKYAMVLLFAAAIADFLWRSIPLALVIVWFSHQGVSQVYTVLVGAFCLSAHLATGYMMAYEDNGAQRCVFAVIIGVTALFSATALVFTLMNNNVDTKRIKITACNAAFSGVVNIAALKFVHRRASLLHN